MKRKEIEEELENIILNYDVLEYVPTKIELIDVYI